MVQHPLNPVKSCTFVLFGTAHTVVLVRYGFPPSSDAGGKLRFGETVYLLQVISSLNNFKKKCLNCFVGMVRCVGAGANWRGWSPSHLTTSRKMLSTNEHKCRKWITCSRPSTIETYCSLYRTYYITLRKLFIRTYPRTKAIVPIITSSQDTYLAVVRSYRNLRIFLLLRSYQYCPACKNLLIFFIN